MKSKYFLIVAGLMLVLFSYSSAQVPQMINYQGKITKSTGAPLDTTISMIFSIYADSAGTILKWTETQGAVVVEKGIFNVLLGNVNPIPDTVFNGDIRYLGVTVGTDPEITPRREIVSVPYAYKAFEADTSDYARGGPGVVGDNDWTFRVTDTSDTTLITGGAWGIARYGNTLYGSADSTHVNLGVACATGSSGQNYKYCTVGGGYFNIVSSQAGTVGGGESNTVSGSAATVGGGYENTASGYSATVGGGWHNTASFQAAAVGGGEYNTASSMVATVGGGAFNSAIEYSATVGGGSENTASGEYSTVVGGVWNTASGEFATVGGGGWNAASGDFSFAAGQRAKANHTGTFVWADLTVADFTSTGNNQFLIRASGGVGIGTTNPQGALDVNSTTGALIVPRMTTAQRDALTPVNGMIIYNTTTNQFNFYEAGAWVTK